MSCVSAYLDGPALSPLQSHRPRKLTPAQALARRNALWLFGFKVGFYDPATHSIRPHSVAEIAELFGKSRQAVLNGIASARRVRAAVVIAEADLGE